MAIGGLVYAPYPAVTTTALQKVLPTCELAAGAAGWFALLTIVTPAGTAIGGPLVATLGARVTLLGSGLATVALAVLVTAALAVSRAAAHAPPARAGPATATSPARAGLPSGCRTKPADQAPRPSHRNYHAAACPARDRSARGTRRQTARPWRAPLPSVEQAVNSAPSGPPLNPDGKLHAKDRTRKG